MERNVCLLWITVAFVFKVEGSAADRPVTFFCRSCNEVVVGMPGGEKRFHAFPYTLFDQNAAFTENPQGKADLPLEGRAIRFYASAPGWYTIHWNGKTRRIWIPRKKQRRVPFIRYRLGRKVFDEYGKPRKFVGVNLAWAIGDEQKMLSLYQKWLEAMEGKVNLIRVWLAPWGFAPIWKDSGLWDFYRRQKRLYVLDQVFEQALSLGIYILLVLYNHGQLNTSLPEAQWDENPYNQKNGGMCQQPRCFFSHRKAIAHQKKVLSYIFERYASFPNLLAWEWWNEVDLTDGYNVKLVRKWLQIHQRTLRDHDAYRHLQTISFSLNFLTGKEIWKLPFIDLVPLHLYRNTCGDFKPLFREATQSARVFNKPVFISEFGIGPTFPPYLMAQDPQGQHLKEAIAFSRKLPHIATAMPWWWDTYIDRFHLWDKIF